MLDDNNEPLQRFEYGIGRLPIAMETSDGRFYFVYDQVGSLRAVIDGSGAIVKTVRYDSFGNIIFDSNPDLSIPFGFAGGLHDRDTGLVRFGARDYDPEVGRWTAKDPIWFAGGTTLLYQYAGNSPIGNIDPDGLHTRNFGGILPNPLSVLPVAGAGGGIPIPAGRAAAAAIAKAAAGLAMNMDWHDDAGDDAEEDAGEEDECDWPRCSDDIVEKCMEECSMKYLGGDRSTDKGQWGFFRCLTECYNSYRCIGPGGTRIK